METWFLIDPQICVACILHSSDKGISDYRFPDDMPNYQNLGCSGSWQIVMKSEEGRKYIIGLYRSRLFIFYDKNLKEPISTDEFLRLHLVPFLKSDLIHIISEIKKAFSGNVIDIFHYPVVTTNGFKIQKDKKSEFARLAPKIDWFGDALTSFYYPIFDSIKNKHSFIRISRHVTICYGLSSPIIKELINLVYEEILYKFRSNDHSEIDFGVAEAALMNGLSRNTVPTQLNLFLQGLTIRATFYLAFIGILITIISLFIQSFSNWTIIIVYTLALIASILGWFLINRLPVIKLK